MGGAAEDAAPVLIHAMEHGPDDFETGDGPIPARTYVVEALGKVGGPGVIPAVVAFLEVRSPRVGTARKSLGGVEAALDVLGGFGPASSPGVQVIIEFLDAAPQHSAAGNAAARALGGIGDERAIGPLTKAVAEGRGLPDSAVALGRFGSSAVQAGPALLSALEKGVSTAAEKLDSPLMYAHLSKAELTQLTMPRETWDRFIVEDTPKRWYALKPFISTLSEIGYQPAIPTLASLLRNPLLAETAAYALGRYGPHARAAIPDLVELLGSRGQWEAVHQTPSSVALRNSITQRSRMAALQALGSIGGLDAALAAASLVDDADDPELRRLALLALGGNAEAPVLAEIVFRRLLGTPDRQQRLQTVSALMHATFPAADDLLLLALGDQDRSVRCRAEEAIAARASGPHQPHSPSGRRPTLSQHVR
jgi:HEAT repeat protein